MKQIRTTCIVRHRETGKHMENERCGPPRSQSKHQKNKSRVVSTRVLVNVLSVGSINSTVSGTER